MSPQTHPPVRDDSVTGTARPGTERRRFAILIVLLFALINVVGLFAIYRALEPGPLVVRVAKVSAQGAVDVDHVLSIRFDRDVLAREPSDEEAVRSARGRLDLFAEDAGGIVPDGAIPLDGELVWLDRRTLRFRPREKLALATPFRAVLSPEIGLGEGLTFEGEREFRFHTTGLQLVGVRQTGYSRDLHATLRLRFDQVVLPADLDRHLTLVDGAGELLEFAIISKAAARDLDVRTVESVNTVEVRLAVGLRGRRGVLGLGEEVRRSVVLTHRLRLSRIHSERAYLDSPDIFVDFNNPVDTRAAGNLEDYFRIEPKIDFTVSSYRRSRLRVEGEFEPGKVYRVTVLQGLPGIGGSSRGRRAGSRRAEPASTQGSSVASSVGKTVLITDETRRVTIPNRHTIVSFRDHRGFLSPHGNRRLALVTSNVEKVSVAAHRVMPNNLVHYMIDGIGGLHHEAFTRPGATKEFEFDTPPNKISETALFIDDLTGGEPRGIWFVEARSVGENYDFSNALVAVSDLALSVKTSGGGFLIWATSIHGGEPVSRARVSMWARNNQMLAFGFTGKDGLLRFEGPFDGADGAPFAIVAEKDEDLSYLDLAEHRLSTSPFDVRGVPYVKSGYEAFLYSDRGVYRPGDAVHLEAVVRDRFLESAGGFPVEFEILRPDNRTVATLPARVRASGGVSAELRLPGSARTGQYLARLRIPGAEGDSSDALGTMRFLVEEFVPQRMRVDVGIGEAAGVEATMRCSPGDEVTILVHGEYLAGLPAAGSPVKVDWEATPGVFRSEKHPGFHFGDGKLLEGTLAGPAGGGVLDENGEMRLSFVIPEIRQSVPLVLRLRASADDTSGRAVRASTTFDVDPSPFYVGMKRAFTGQPERGTPVKFECAAVKVDGEPMDLEQLELAVERIEWTTAVEETKSGRYRYVSRQTSKETTRHVVGLEKGLGEVEVLFSKYGNYRLTLSEKSGGVLARDDFWVTGSGWNYSRSFERPEELEMEVLDGVVRPGGEARVLVRSPFPGTLLLTTETDRVLDARVESLPTNHSVFTVSVPADATGNLYVAGSVIHGVDPKNKWSSPRAFGVVPLELDFSSRQLAVSVYAPKLLAPGREGSVMVTVAGADGQPHAAEVSLALVDEGILAWTEHETPNPFARFYEKRAHGVNSADGYGSLLREVSLEMKRATPGGGKADARARGLRGGDSRRLTLVRSGRVKSTVIWLGTFETDADGRVVEWFDLPDFTGELRVMAVAHRGPAFGMGEERIRVRAPLHLEVGLPRFVAPGDKLVSAVDVFNNSGDAGIGTVEWKLSGPLEPSTRAAPELAFSSLSTKEIGIDNGSSRRLYRGLEATEDIGVSVMRVEASLGDEKASASIEMPVRPASPLVVESSSGGVTQEKPWERTIGERFVAGSARHRLVLTPLPDVDLLGSLRYLIRYPHGCLEQTTSRVFPLLYLEDLARLVDERYGADTSGVVGRGAEIDGFLQAGIDRLISMLTRSGWMPMWPGANEPWAWGSVYGAHFLVEARRRGLDVPEAELELALDWLEKGLVDREQGKASSLDRAYAVHVLALAGRREGLSAKIDAMLDRHDQALTAASRGERRSGELSAEARFLLAASSMTLGEIGRARGALGEDLPEPLVSRDQGGSLRSPARQSALLLSTLLDVSPSSPWVAALASRLRGYRVEGRWGTTQENAMALLALGKYAKMRRAQGSNYTATIQIGEEEPVKITATDTRVFEGDYSGKRIRVSLEGDGTLYWFLVEEGVTADGVAPDVDSGVAVRRRYLDAKGEDVSSRALRQGEAVIVEIRVTANRELQNLVVTDLLPGTLEVENPRLDRMAARVGAPPATAESRLPVEYLDVRDDRVLLYVGAMTKGTSVHRYAARAVTRGDFRVAAVAAEGLYDPGVYSRHGGGRLVVVAAESR